MKTNFFLYVGIFLVKDFLRRDFIFIGNWASLRKPKN